jgi:signal transduction histidine kinase
MNLLGLLRRASLREKFVAVVSLVIISSLIIISGYLIKRQNEIYHYELEKRGEALVTNLAYNSEYGVIIESTGDLENLIKGVAMAEDVIYVAIVSADGRVLAETGTNIRQNTTQINTHLGATTNENDSLENLHFRTDKGVEYIELRYPIRTQKQAVSREDLGKVAGFDNTGTSYEKIGEVIINLGLENLKREISKSQTTSVLLTLMVVVTAIIIMTAFVRVITRPIESLVEMAEKISKGDMSKKVEIIWQDEIGQLAESFNRMIESLNKSQEEVENYNRTLEEKIMERTKELEGAQTQLIQTEKMAAIGQLSAGVAHELNNPLGGILGYSQFALEKIESKELSELTTKDIESYKRYLRDIETQSKRCKAIVQNLLRFSRTSQIIEFHELNINNVLEETLTFLDHQLMMNQITLRKVYDNNIPQLQGNLGQLQQVFTNIILNAMHASRPGSSISVGSRFLPSLGEFSGAVEVTISDEGIGISEENVKKIFEPFFTTKEIGKGTGLGLSVSYGIIKEHGGEIKVKSKQGVGTTFSIILPLEKKANLTDKIYSR